MNISKKKLRGALASTDNKRRYAEEIAKMESLGEKFPINQFGRVSVGGFAARCGFSRSVIEGGALGEQFAADVRRISLATVEDVPRLRKKADDRQKIASNLQRQLILKTAEIENLSKKVEELSKQLRESQISQTERNQILEHMLATGERFFL